jgi:hypothetical protein
VVVAIIYKASISLRVFCGNTTETVKTCRWPL